MQEQDNNQFFSFARQLLDQQSQSIPEMDEHKDSSLDMSQLIKMQHTIHDNILISPEPSKRKGSPLLPSDDPCNCSKSECRKMYCECLAKGRLCSSACRCENCQNRTSNKKVLHVIQELDLNRNLRKIKSKRFKDGCTCKKSMCLKKYCECFHSGKSCGYGCNCENCQNQLLDENQKNICTPNQKKTSKFSSKFESANTNTRSEYYGMVLKKFNLEEYEDSDDSLDKMNTVVIMIYSSGDQFIISKIQITYIRLVDCLIYFFTSKTIIKYYIWDQFTVRTNNHEQQLPIELLRHIKSISTQIHQWQLYSQFKLEPTKILSKHNIIKLKNKFF